MNNRINLVFRALGTVAALLVFAFIINAVISQMKDNSTAASETEISTSTLAVPTELSYVPLLAFTSTKDNNTDIYTIRADGSDLTRLTNYPGFDGNPVWSSDGRLIAYESGGQGGGINIFSMNPDGSGKRPLTANDGINSAIHWSPDGQKIAYISSTTGEPRHAQLMVMNADGSRETNLIEIETATHYWPLSWSPDGQYIAFIAPEPQESLPENRELSRIYVVAVDGGAPTNITKLLPANEDIFNWSYSWSSDGQSITFIADRYPYENGNGKSTLYEASLDGATLTEIDHVGTHMWDWWNGTSLILSLAGSQPFTWLRPDGTHSILNPFENCADANIQHGVGAERSITGDLIIGAGCANDEWWFYWANPDGTVIKPLLNYPIQTKEGSFEFIWSLDGSYVILHLFSSDNAGFYIVNIQEALKDPSDQPTQLIEDNIFYYSPSWQPIP